MYAARREPEPPSCRHRQAVRRITWDGGVPDRKRRPRGPMRVPQAGSPDRGRPHEPTHPQRGGEQGTEHGARHSEGCRSQWRCARAHCRRTLRLTARRRAIRPLEGTFEGPRGPARWGQGTSIVSTAGRERVSRKERPLALRPVVRLGEAGGLPGVTRITGARGKRWGVTTIAHDVRALNEVGRRFALGWWLLGEGIDFVVIQETKMNRSQKEAGVVWHFSSGVDPANAGEVDAARQGFWRVTPQQPQEAMEFLGEARVCHGHVRHYLQKVELLGSGLVVAPFDMLPPLAVRVAAAPHAQRPSRKKGRFYSTLDSHPPATKAALVGSQGDLSTCLPRGVRPQKRHVGVGALHPSADEGARRSRRATKTRRQVPRGRRRSCHNQRNARKPCACRMSMKATVCRTTRIA